jgi:hypothetical protein
VESVVGVVRMGCVGVLGAVGVLTMGMGVVVVVRMGVWSAQRRTKCMSE